jgi:hypothetical protein
MAYFTEQQLERFAESYDLEKRASQFLNESKASAGLSIFLSHSHKDRKKARGLIRHFAGLGVEVYVDWNDSDMPRETNRETAERIKSKIDETRLFMVLATRNALDSKWVPWEIGVADKTKGEAAVLIIPVEDASGHFAGSEYLRLYRRVMIADDGKDAVFEPDKTKGSYLKDYFTVFSR